MSKVVFTPLIQKEYSPGEGKTNNMVVELVTFLFIRPVALEFWSAAMYVMPKVRPFTANLEGGLGRLTALGMLRKV